VWVVQLVLVVVFEAGFWFGDWEVACYVFVLELGLDFEFGWVFMVFWIVV